MKSLKYSIKLTAPTIISGIAGDSVTNSCLSYIPGTTILGMLATRYIKKYETDSEFERLFLRGALQFRNLYIQKEGKRYLPCPKNILQNKKDKNIFHILSQENDEDIDLLDYNEVNGYSYIIGESIDLHNPEFSINFHHQRNYKTGIPEENVIFNYEALDPNQIFNGEIIGEEEDLQLISALLEEKEVRIGKSKTAQYGNAEIISYKIEDFPLSETTSNPIYLYCVSDLIIFNQFGFSSSSVEDLEKLLGAKISEAYTESSRTESVVMAWKAKKPSYNTLKAGSIFLLEALPKNYQDILVYGLGERTWEGFGEVQFITLPLKLSNYVKKSTPITKPQYKIPPFIRENILQKIYENQIYNGLKDRAIKKAAIIDCSHLSKSLVAKLEIFASKSDFYAMKQMLNNTALNRLKKVYIGYDSLYDFLQESHLENEIKDILRDIKSQGREKKLSELKEEFELEDIEFEEARKAYLVNFFWFLRKKLEGESKKEENK